MIEKPKVGDRVWRLYCNDRMPEEGEVMKAMENAENLPHTKGRIPVSFPSFERGIYLDPQNLFSTLDSLLDDLRARAVHLD